MIYQLVKGISKLTSYTEKILSDITLLRFKIVNACILGDASGWILVDTGLENSYEYILRVAEEQFGSASKPNAIILTHGHFDHIGSAMRLANHWNLRIYAHEKEFPYLTGEKDYPKPDPSSDEGLVAKMSPTFPHASVDFGARLSALPPEGQVPGISGWEWIPTPGHTPGHVSLYRERDRIMFAGDALTTTKQESFLSVLTQREQVKGPPAYLTPDWESAKRSVQRITELAPNLMLPSHGSPMEGEELKKHLTYLSEHFEQVAVPLQ
jgi:glyoxylase-like metal-dependent hydrolase (beta-lactamase superfamily II)